MRRAMTMRENEVVTAVSMDAISSTLVLFGRAVTVTLALSLEAKLMALFLVWVGLYRLQRVLVGKRRCSGRWLVQYGAMAAYYLPAPLAFYAASALCSTTTTHIDGSTPWLVFGVSRMFRFTVPVRMGVPLVTNMRAYSLRDRPRDRYNFLMWLVFLGLIDWEWATISGSNWPGRLQLAGHLCVYFGMLFIILFDHTSESTLDCQTKAVADYMKRQKSSKPSSTSSPFFDDDDANSHSSLQLLDCCGYPFVQGEDGEWVTLKELFHQCGDQLLPRDKDICLSYSLCRLLARRYYGFHCAEEGDDMVRRFAFTDPGRRDGYKRAFEAVEVQLAFLHDYFFTSSLPIIQQGLHYIEVAQTSTTILTFLVAILKRSSTVELDTTHLLVIVMLGMLFLLLDTLCVWLLLPVQDLLAIYWRPIHTAFRKLSCLPNGRLTANGLVRLFRFGPNPNAHDVFDGVYWRNKIGQYSILQDFDRRRSPKKALVAWFQGIMLSQPSYEFIKHLPAEEEQVNMQKLDSVREFVADTLLAIDGPPTNGSKYLKISMDSFGHDLLWTCREETHTDTILIWHIATCYCDITPIISDDPSVKRHHEAARALSRYCAYLVAFLPEFVPEHSLTTKQVFPRVLQEAQSALGAEPMKEEEEKRTKIRGLQLPDQHEQRTTFHKGVELGRQLEMIDDDKARWKVIAEFWAETILYVAPSDNAEAHIEHLAKGGEFITHLWAMLSNAGILKRATGEWHPPPASTTNRGEPQNKIKTTKARTQECPF